MTRTITFNAYDFETARMAVDTNGIMEKVKGISLARIYRKQLRAYRRMAQVIDRHRTLSNIALGLQIAAGIVAVFLFA